MKKILSVIDTLDESIKSYCSYNVDLSKNNKLYLDFIYNYKEEVNNNPVLVTGSGLSYPQNLVQANTYANHELELENLTKPFKAYYRKVNYLIGKGELLDKINIQTRKQRYLLCTMRKLSSDSWWNVMFGTTETELSKATKIPCLFIPDKYNYSKPQTLLMFMNSYDKKAFKKLKRIARTLGLYVRIVVENTLARKQLKLIQTELATTSCFDTMIIELKNEQLEAHYINALIKKFEIDWVGYSNYDKNMLERMFKVSENKLLLESDIPTLII